MQPDAVAPLAPEPGDAAASPAALPPADAGASLPENAYRELKPGERYEPIVPASADVPELTVRSVVFGLANALFWSAAVAYLTLKLGQGLEAAIPIAILAVGAGALFKRKSTLPENVNILAFGATSGIVVGGSLFVMPAIHILGLESLSSFFQIFFVPLLGAALGVLFLIPMRRYFVREMHGKLPFPEGTATTEVLVAGQKGGQHARVLLKALGLGFVFDLMPTLFEAWRENFTTAAFTFLAGFTQKTRAVFALNTTAAIAGLGYLIGVRYAAIILGGSLLSSFVIVPLLPVVAPWIGAWLGPEAPNIPTMTADDLFGNYARFVGIGAIFMAGVISIAKMLPVMGKALAEGVRALRGERQADPPRTDRDIPMPVVVVLLGAVIAGIWIYFRFAVLHSQQSPTLMATLAVGLAVIIALLFSAVSAWAVAMISVTPISGMTLMTLIVGAVLLKWLGLSGREGMLGVLLIGGVVCTCLSMTGTLVTEFKVSYWIGATPRRVQWANLAGAVVSALAVTAVMLLLAKVYGFSKTDAHPNPLPAPQANAMAGVLTFIMQSGDSSRWYLLGAGALVAVVVEFFGISALAFAMGMYLPIEYNSPILLGALVAHYVRKSSKDETLSRARNDRGILVSSGLIAGGALAGVCAALVRFIESSTAGADGEGGFLLPRIAYTEGNGANVLGLVMFLGVCGYIWWDARRAKKEDAGPSLQM